MYDINYDSLTNLNEIKNQLISLINMFGIVTDREIILKSKYDDDWKTKCLLQQYLV